MDQLLVLSLQLLLPKSFKLSVSNEAFHCLIRVQRLMQLSRTANPHLVGSLEASLEVLHILLPQCIHIVLLDHFRDAKFAILPPGLLLPRHIDTFLVPDDLTNAVLDLPLDKQLALLLQR